MPGSSQIFETEYDLRRIAQGLSNKFPGVHGLYLFGSRRYRTLSPRSDVDVLVHLDQFIRPSDLRLFAQLQCPALDIFIIDGAKAVSATNESYLEATTFDALIDMLRAVKFWSRDEGFLEADIDWKFSIRDDLEFRPTALLPSNPSVDSVLPNGLFSGTRSYIERVVDQINASYNYGLFDCCAVMCRRLLETLIIETYESKGLGSDIKAPGGHFMMFSGLLSQVESETRFTLERNALAGLKAFKTLGDLSAHNRRFNARQDDIDRIRNDLRVAAEILLYESELKS